jgi:hypothetical protein
VAEEPPADKRPAEEPPGEGPNKPPGEGPPPKKLSADESLLFDFEGIGSSAWREEALTRAVELRGLARWIQESVTETNPASSGLATKIHYHLDKAIEAAAQKDRKSDGRLLPILWSRFRRSLVGANFERTLGSLDAVEADLIRIAPDDYVRALMPSLEAHVNRFLPKDDPRRKRLAPLAAKAEKEDLKAPERGAAVNAFHAANTQRRRELLRLRTFRNVLVAATSILLLVAAGLGILGAFQPTLMPICFTPDSKVVCPTSESSLPASAPGASGTEAGQAGATSTATATTGDIDEAIDDTVSAWDVGLVELIGLVAAAVAAAFTLRRIRGTSTPYSLPVSLAALKLATGTLTAFLGLMLMRGNFVPGLSALDSSAQILAWAIVFGYSQQLFTRLIDQQAQNVLESVGGQGPAGDRPSPQNADLK